VTLALKEFELLTFLIENAGRVVTRDSLMENVWGYDYFGDTKTIDVHVKRLRTKIESNPAEPTKITTIRGLGYRYEKTKNT
jgi:two-component system response regulator RegX3